MASKSLDATLCQCRQVLRRTANTRSSIRAFSSSTARRSNLPILNESSNPELNNLYSDIRSKIFVPGYVTSTQRKLMFSGKQRALLTNDPFYVDIGDESVQLLPLDATKDVPSHWRSLMSVIRLMEDDSEQWNNLPGLLEGMRTSGRKFKSWQWEWIARHAGEGNAAGQLLESIRRSKRTGFTLIDTKVVREVMWAMRQKAVLGNWSMAATNRAFELTQLVVRILEEEDHAGGRLSQAKKEVIELNGDPRRQPDIIGVMLELAAVRAQKAFAGQDSDGEVQRILSRLVPNLGNDPHGEKTSEPGSHRISEADYQLLRWVPVLNGLRQASKIPGLGPVQEAAKSHIERLSKLTNEARKDMGDLPAEEMRKRRGIKWYDALNKE